jgi:hypothetical protein
LLNSLFRHTLISTTAEISQHKPEDAKFIDHVQHYSPQFACTRTTETEVEEMKNCLLEHRAHALNQPWGTYDYQRAIEYGTAYERDRCWSCYGRGIIHESIEGEQEAVENSENESEDESSFGYSDYTMGTGQTGDISSEDTDLGDTDVSL